jgi:formylmethanofuran dehydrogenase subunit E
MTEIAEQGGPDSTICPICGEGTLRTVDFGDQQPESREVQTFTCGHEVKGARLKTADADQLDVERRESEDTVMPVETGDE